MSRSVPDSRVWVVGAGLQGCAIALELAHRGQPVVLLDQDALPMNRASLRNEGKMTLPLFRVALNPRFTRPFYAVPRTSAARTASG